MFTELNAILETTLTAREGTGSEAVVWREREGGGDIYVKNLLFQTTGGDFQVQ